MAHNKKRDAVFRAIADPVRDYEAFWSATMRDLKNYVERNQ